MVVHAQEEAARIQAVVAALQQEEITISEFTELITSLTAESIQLIELLLTDWGNPQYESTTRLISARVLCRRMATCSRVLS